MGLTLQRDERVLKSIEFRRVLRQGRRYRTPHLTIVAVVRSNGRVRLGLTVSRKVGNAVVRNRVKRRLREVVRHQRQGLLRPWDIVVIAQPSAGTATFQRLWAEVRPVLEDLSRQDEAAVGGSSTHPASSNRMKRTGNRSAGTDS